MKELKRWQEPAQQMIPLTEPCFLSTWPFWAICLVYKSICSVKSWWKTVRWICVKLCWMCVCPATHSGRFKRLKKKGPYSNFSPQGFWLAIISNVATVATVPCCGKRKTYHCSNSAVVAVQIQINLFWVASLQAFTAAYSSLWCHESKWRHVHWTPSLCLHYAL